MHSQTYLERIQISLRSSIHLYPMNPLLSIVTINYNNSQGLQATIDSLRDVGACKEVECIFIDGGSADKSLEYANEFPIFSTITSEPDCGIYNAMNKGLSQARGKYVLWINSGDRLHSTQALRQAILHLSGSNADIVGMGLRILDPSTGSVLKTVNPSKSAMELPHGTLPHPSTCFKRSTLIAIGGYDEKYSIAADRDLILRLFFRGCQIEAKQEILTDFFSGGTSSSRSVHYENKRIDLRYGLISRKTYLLWMIKYGLGSVLAHRKN
jgi:glycosyltransferase involved in cell wall biosynthesis